MKLSKYVPKATDVVFICLIFTKLPIFGNISKEMPTFHLKMHCFWCELASESIHLNEHEASAWLGRENLHSVKWLPADEGVLVKIEEAL